MGGKIMVRYLIRGSAVQFFAAALFSIVTFQLTVDHSAAQEGAILQPSEMKKAIDRKPPPILRKPIMPDLEVVKIPASNGEYCAVDGLGNLIVQIKNTSKLIATQPVDIAIRFPDGTSRRLRTPGGLAAGAKAQVSTPLIESCYKQGCSFTVTIDPKNFIAEQNEGNNTVNGTCPKEAFCRIDGIQVIKEEPNKATLLVQYYLNYPQRVVLGGLVYGPALQSDQFSHAPAVAPNGYHSFTDKISLIMSYSGTTATTNSIIDVSLVGPKGVLCSKMINWSKNWSPN